MKIIKKKQINANNTITEIHLAGWLDRWMDG